MKRALVMMVLNAAFSLSTVSAPVRLTGKDCEVAPELTVSGDLGRDMQGELLLRGKIHNSSTYLEFRDVVVKADLCDDTGNVIDTQTFTVKEDVEKGEIEDFAVALKPSPRVTSVDYTVLCADHGFAGIGY